MSHLDQDTLEDIRAALKARRAELLQENLATQSDIRAADQDQGGRDSLDESTAEQGLASQLRFADRDRKLLRKIDGVIELIDSGDYGACEICEEPIQARRLRIRPMTTLCIDCKEDQERLEAQQRTRPGLIEE